MNSSSADAQRKVFGPAIALIVLCSISIGVLLVGLIFSLWLIVSGMADALAQPNGMSKETQVTIRIVWNVLMQVFNLIILVGAVRMKGLRSLGLAKTACVLTLFPCLGPCFILGIPFGIWGLIVLSDQNVRRAFQS